MSDHALQPMTCGTCMGPWEPGHECGHVPRTGRPPGTMLLRSLAFRTCVYFAANPDETLLTGDIVEKFGLSDQRHVHHALVNAVGLGLVAKDGTRAGQGRQATWRAGSELLRLIGRAA